MLHSAYSVPIPWRDDTLHLQTPGPKYKRAGGSPDEPIPLHSVA